MTRFAEQIGDRTLFDELRVDPYYRTLAARRDPMPRRRSTRLIASLAAHPRSLVHADFSPKNLLVSAGGLMLVDFETGHYGDPAFDLGFFLSHLVLKACLQAPGTRRYLELTEQFRNSPMTQSCSAEYRRQRMPNCGLAACKTSPAAPGHDWTARARSSIYPMSDAASECAHLCRDSVLADRPWPRHCVARDSLRC